MNIVKIINLTEFKKFIFYLDNYFLYLKLYKKLKL